MAETTTKQDPHLYPLSDTQSMLKWAEVFSIEKKKTKEINVLSFFVRPRFSPDADVKKEADALEKALNDVIRYNDSLRIRMVKTIRGMRQYIKEYTYYPVERLKVDGETGFRKYIGAADQYTVDWYGESIFFARLLEINAHQCALFLRIHHALIDGYSIRLLMEQLEAGYNAYMQGVTPEPPKKTYSVINCFQDLERYRKSEAHKKDRAYWFKKYNTQRRYSFPAGYRSERGACDVVTDVVKPDVYQKIMANTHELGVSLQSYMMTMAALTTYVLTKKENFCIYSLTHGRHTFAAKKTIGCVQNTIPTFYDLHRDEPMAGQITACYMDFLEALSHGRFSMGEQVPLSYPESVLHGMNFNHGWLLFSAMEYGAVTEAEGGMEMEFLPQANLPSQFYMSMLETPGDHITFELGYQIRKYKKEKAEKIIHTYIRVCEFVAEHTDFTPAQIREEINK